MSFFSHLNHIIHVAPVFYSVIFTVLGISIAAVIADYTTPGDA